MQGQGFTFFLEQPFPPVSSQTTSVQITELIQHLIFPQLHVDCILEPQTDPSEVSRSLKFMCVPFVPIPSPPSHNWPVLWFIFTVLPWNNNRLWVNVFYSFLPWTLVKSWPGTWFPDFLPNCFIHSWDMQLCKQCSKWDQVHSHEVESMSSDIHYTGFSIFYLAQELKWSLREKHPMQNYNCCHKPDISNYVYMKTHLLLRSLFCFFSESHSWRVYWKLAFIQVT